jgi:alkanesulfonate monooxygenase SsuD/methylene tetrahydromethanopterin reductase-like flavin-dependent oxidoreductase (luciferase family)
LNAPRPIQGWPVIFMPVASGDEYAVAGRVADVALVSGSTPDDVRRTGAAISGNGDRVIRILADVVPILGQTVDEARRKANAVPDYPGDAFRFAGTPEQLAALMREWNTAGVCDGFNLRRSQLPSEVDLLVAAVTALARPPAVRGATLRDRLNLPRPASRYAA